MKPTDGNWPPPDMRFVAKCTDDAECAELRQDLDRTKAALAVVWEALGSAHAVICAVCADFTGDRRKVVEEVLAKIDTAFADVTGERAAARVAALRTMAYALTTTEWSDAHRALEALDADHG